MDDVVRMDKGEQLEYTSSTPAKLFYDIDYVAQTWLEHKLHHLYPEAGGYNDQCPYLMKDWHTFNLYYSRVAHGDLNAPPLPTNPRPWDSLMGD